MTNRLLFRGPALLTWLLLPSAQALSQNPEDDKIRVACAGDSITLGTFSARSYPKQLQDLLGPAYLVRSFAVAEATVLRHTAHPYHRTTEYQSAIRFAPDYVVLEFGTHDSKEENWRGEGGKFSSDYSKLIEELQQIPSQPEVILMVPPPIYHNKPYGMNPQVVEYVIRTQVTSIARVHGLPRPIDTFGEFLEHCPLSDTHCDRMKWDGVHPNAQGDGDIARLVSGVIKSPQPFRRHADKTSTSLTPSAASAVPSTQRLTTRSTTRPPTTTTKSRPPTTTTKSRPPTTTTKSRPRTTSSENRPGTTSVESRSATTSSQASSSATHEKALTDVTLMRGPLEAFRGSSRTSTATMTTTTSTRSTLTTTSSNTITSTSTSSSSGKSSSINIAPALPTPLPSQGGISTTQSGATDEASIEDSEDGENQDLGCGENAALGQESHYKRGCRGRGGSGKSFQADHEHPPCKGEQKLNDAPDDSPKSRWRLFMNQSMAQVSNRSGLSYPRYELRMHHGDEVQFQSILNTWLGVSRVSGDRRLAAGHRSLTGNAAAIVDSAERQDAATFVVECHNVESEQPGCLFNEVVLKCKANGLYVQVNKGSKISCSSENPWSSNQSKFLVEPVSRLVGLEFVTLRALGTGRYLSIFSDNQGAVTKADGEPGAEMNLWQVRLMAGYETVRPLIRGVNLGGWLLLEKWIAEDLFLSASGEPFGGCVALDERGLMEALGPNVSRQRMEKHWSSWVVEDDIAWLAHHGINTVRVPVGYWVAYPTEPFVDGQLRYLDSLFEWCEVHHVAILLDFHGLKGSHNGNQNTGNCGACGNNGCGDTWVRFLEEPEMRTNTDVVSFLAARYAHRPAFLGFAVATQVSDKVNKTSLMHFYRQAYGTIRNHSKDALIVLDGSLLPIDAVLNDFREVATDLHVYFGLLPTLPASVQEVNLHTPALDQEVNLVRAKGAVAEKQLPVVVGEWSLAIGGHPQRSEEPLEHGGFFEAFARAQLEAWEMQGVGWFFCNYKTRIGNPSWSFREVCDAGWLPGCKHGKTYGPVMWWRAPKVKPAYVGQNPLGVPTWLLVVSFCISIGILAFGLTCKLPKTGLGNLSPRVAQAEQTRESERSQYMLLGRKA